MRGQPKGWRAPLGRIRATVLQAQPFKQRTHNTGRPGPHAERQCISALGGVRSSQSLRTIADFELRRSMSLAEVMSAFEK